ncbi:adenylate/guanylate cyclase domain-containing protein [Agrobacterium rubi]|uniref:Adenylate/guanylate cyclase domain-containing protein n=1 Tax=Agrobacterium rubi TaxID=28099 RepID=A0AAE7R6A0_9HYPH|nr:adenylate/guanylate cyclase domain-containing protein [Agrobacterium rubi]MBP1878770.1 adenylate cyclase [Agrobacterium rubi]MCL6652869.1 adenylate cyclase [Agrobacterium rubi]NTE88607.1 adenylate/guanylate cyclase domain-containing protein [Agrobacterium rubi]NTF04435.1 adenylate/guanylate cyclase domain-containing protein [Agrobacterium rubi]NTF09968.1 adenylate/guanylate cyclase domain-containing protein [Agrobacterium rubi]
MTDAYDADLSPYRASDQLWPSPKSEILNWLVLETHEQRFIDNIFVELCQRLNKTGVSVARASLNFMVEHPQWRGARILWLKGRTEAEFTTYAYGTENTQEYRNSPIYEIHSGADELRHRLDVPPATPEFAIYADLRAEGLTEYCAWPLKHTFDKRHVITFSSDQPGGFTDAEIDLLRSLIPAISLVSEIRLKNRIARTLLETYVGPHASQAILDGATRRGSGTTVGAAILICDLRDFTHISDLWPRDDVIELLNSYFDAMSDPIEKFGGEILKFMGDGLLAIFPLSDPDACKNLIAAIEEAQIHLQALNEANIKRGHEPLGYGIGVHVGDVMYGNIGSKSRLDFTVIGPAVNIASRLESLTKHIKRTVLMSQTFVEMAGDIQRFESIGAHTLRGLENPIHVYALPTADNRSILS